MRTAKTGEVDFL